MSNTQFLSSGMAAVITKSDTVDLQDPGNPTSKSLPKAIYVGGTGHLAVVFPGDQAPVLFSAVPVGTILPISPQRINSTNTTASLMVAIY